MKKPQLEMVKEAIEKIEAEGHGEVVVKIKNGYIWRILTVNDKLLDKKQE